MRSDRCLCCDSDRTLGPESILNQATKGVDIMEINRNYSHKTHGNIGAATLVVPDGKWTLNGTVLPESSVEHLVRFALQTLQDAYAGADNSAEAVAFFNAKLDKILKGTIGTRGGGDGADPRTSIERSYVRGSVKASFGAKSPEWAKFTGLEPTAQLAKLDEWVATVKADKDENAKLDEYVAGELARRELAAKNKKSVAKKITFSI